MKAMAGSRREQPMLDSKAFAVIRATLLINIMCVVAAILLKEVSGLFLFIIACANLTQLIGIALLYRREE